MKSFIIKILVIVVILKVTGFLVFTYFPQYNLSVFNWALLFFAISSIAIHAYQVNLAKKNFSLFTRSTMLVTFIKLIVYAAFAIIYIAFDTPNAKIFVVGFLLLYLIFAIAEVTSLLNLKQK